MKWSPWWDMLKEFLERFRHRPYRTVERCPMCRGTGKIKEIHAGSDGSFGVHNWHDE